MPKTPAEFIIHPCETLKDILIDRNLLVEDLIRGTQFPIQYVIDFMAGQASVTRDFAYALDRYLDIDASFWINLQMFYDAELRGN